MSVLAFLGLICLGAFLLMLPAASIGHRIGLVDALFSATSAACVTGLVVLDTGTALTTFGQSVVLGLIQVGGLGIMTMSTAFLLMLGKRLSGREHVVVKNTIAKGRIGSLRLLIGYVMLITFTCEFVGAVILYLRFQKVTDFSPYRAFYHAVFHSVSAFCNAGFSLNRNSLMNFGQDWCITATIGGLILLGGIGFVVLFNLSHFYFWRKNRLQRGRIRLHSKLALLTSLILLAVMFGSLLAGEWSNTIRGLPLGEKVSRCFFQALTPRTAGFNTLPVEKLAPENQWLTMLMMFVGASPSGTGGGIKTSTFAIILAAVYASIVGRERVTIWKKTIPREVIWKAITIIIIGLAVIFAASFLLLLSEAGNISARSSGGIASDIIFEVVSAFGTVGLSHGITPQLSSFGKLVIIATVFIGRVSPLALVLIIGRSGRISSPVTYPEEMVSVG